MIPGRLKTLLMIFLMALMLSPVLSACGKKGKIQPPNGEKTNFPREYPTY
jgi:predicted small lipoprotein YifL